ncbi:precorrin-6y C5,15-methyltransferase (decarboxylating) subunit CbiE [Tardiphaga sp. vice352]|uniref:precorrin-6y C5,15-methyltransferase (decarboxylating) subunit CbiE n=1 Tax=unclassified Tardiphaga TaxID=2631404 RepID=UPI00116237BF|nr:MULTISPECIES: precorrin-6y C5,15-methyltransferase (decarboxylating) subunit CbiE [unclassified Tardiphaga]MBC7585159.1 precorrin-6y C5,15-methyltransferase (decarboxylating) subunit CbiE [Tardiphaga sp.]QDM18166.1 precorrin-6y C5,15-methyltransferase (decarboxylating) subunit CbiE [Tardiphaga sp. vice278]QDM23202.1 precorrin-6y C5,15-methyltransferase (decarboxylating) subunit CbiE [Tardiphaga sp. vice154]QDM33512.1 precorrin-6y C5,15-methyltransferase (decarboxylating) subunit CbiE [Tardip
MTPSSTRPWLSIIGLGEDGLEGLSPAARNLLAQACLVVGGKRHLALAGEFPGERLAWPSPPDAAFPGILARRGQPVCVLASGDPFFYGIGSLLMQHIAAEEMLCLPSASAFSLAASKLGWAQQDCALLTLHGRPLERIIPQLRPGARILALSWDGTTPGKLAGLLQARGMGHSILTVLENIGGPRQRIRQSLADGFALGDIDPLNTIALEVVADHGARIIPRVGSLPDDWFEHDGQITRREMRAVTLSVLAPRRGELMWDIGAGSGSVSIEWMLADPANCAIAIERDPSRIARIQRNALALGVPDLQIVEGAAPGILHGLPQPDAIFVGGGATNDGVLDAAWSALAPRGRLVVNAVTIETQAELTRRFTALGGELLSFNFARADRIGGFHGWRAAMPVVQWSVIKP